MLKLIISLPQYVYTSLIVLFTTVAALIPLTGAKLRDGRGHGRKWYKGYTNFGRLVLLLSIIAAILTFVKDYASEKATRSAEHDAKVEAEAIRVKTEYLADIRTDSSNKNIVTSFANALAKFGLKYDSSANAVIKILDTLKVNQKIVYGADPIVTINSIKQEKDSIGMSNYRIELTVANQPAVNCIIDVRAITQSKTGKLYLDKEVRLIDNQVIPLNMTTSNNILVDKYDSSEKTYFIVFGNYKNSKKQEFPIKEYFSYTKGQNGFGGTSSALRNLLDELLESKGVRL